MLQWHTNVGQLSFTHFVVRSIPAVRIVLAQEPKQHMLGSPHAEQNIWRLIAVERPQLTGGKLSRSSDTG